MELIAQGAEAKIYKVLGENESITVLKDRFPKSYRHETIDRKLRKSRTKREAKVMGKLQELGLNVPKLISVDDKEMQISMEFIEGNKVRDEFEEKYEELSKQIGEIVGTIHSNDIIHGDLTTSNMILNLKKIYLIDFGLTFFSNKIEDKAVDLHLLNQALQSRHHKIHEKSFKIILKNYKKTYKNSKEVISRLDVVEGRGRNKNKESKKTMVKINTTKTK